MGRAIVRQPQVFLFDEPLSNLDAKLRAQTRIEIQKLHRELGITSLFVTHDQVEAMTLAQRMIVMNAGRHGAVRHARGGVSPPRIHLRRQLHRLAADEPAEERSRRPRGNHHGHPPRAPRHRPQRLGSCGWRPIELLGAERLIYGRLGDEQVIVRSEENQAVARARLDHPRGAREDRLHWFDASTGKRDRAA